jgi:hypothetical protein
LELEYTHMSGDQGSRNPCDSLRNLYIAPTQRHHEYRAEKSARFAK